MDFWSSAVGITEVELTSAEPEQALQAINQENLPIFDIRFADSLTVTFRVSRADYRKLKELTGRRGEKLRISDRTGLYWRIRSLKSRKLLVLGVLLFLFLSLFLPTRVLFLRVEGNNQVPTEKILAAAETCGIRFFASRRQVRSEKVKNALLSEVPELQWAGINTNGCVAWIRVQERADHQDDRVGSGVSSIVAARDGILDSCTVTRGNLICTPGQAVRSGQVLISGYTDCGLYIQATQAEGEIYAITKRNLEVIAPVDSATVRELGEVKYKISLLVGKKRINLWKDSGISGTTCGRMYLEYYVTLPGAFQLPLALSVESYFPRETEPLQTVPDADALTDFAQSYLQAQMVAGQIRSSDLSLSEEVGAIRMTGSYICREMIGRVQSEKMGE